MNRKLKSYQRPFCTMFALVISFQLVFAPVMAVTTYAWDFNSDHGFFNGYTRAIQASRPTDVETRGQLWTDLLQQLASNTTISPSVNLKICLLLDITEFASSLGIDMNRTATIALTQANTITKSDGLAVNFTIPAPLAEPTLNGSLASSAYLNLYNQGCRVFVGPAFSFEIFGILADANSRGTPVISPSSTAITLAIAGDELFRTSGSDLTQTMAVAAWMYHQGVRYLAVISPTAEAVPYVKGFPDYVKAAFLALGGSEVADVSAATYDPSNVSDVQTATMTLNSQVGNLINDANGNKTAVGVLDIDFQAGTVMYDVARAENNLPAVNWYGTDIVAGDSRFIPPPGGVGSPLIAAFLAHVNFTGTQYIKPTLGIKGSQMADLAYNGTKVPKIGGGTIDLSGTGYFSMYGSQPEQYWDYMYDATVIAMLSVLKSTAYSGSQLTTNIPLVANRTIGATGLDTLAPTGDRAIQNFIYWAYIASTTPTPPSGNTFTIVLVSVATILVAGTAYAYARRKRLKSQLKANQTTTPQGGS